MPCWEMFVPENCYTEEDKARFSEAITSIYVDYADLPKFYVVVIFHEKAPNSIYVGGKAANSFDAKDPVNTIHWGLRVQHEDVYNYFKKTIVLRRTHPGLRMTSWEAVNRNITSSVPRGDVVVNDIKSGESGDAWKEMIVIYNSGNEFTFSLPGGTWLVAMERSQPVDQERSVTGSVTAEGTAVTVVHQ